MLHPNSEVNFVLSQSEGAFSLPVWEGVRGWVGSLGRAKTGRGKQRPYHSHSSSRLGRWPTSS